MKCHKPYGVGLQASVVEVTRPQVGKSFEKHARTFYHNLLFLKKNTGFKLATKEQILLQHNLG